MSAYIFSLQGTYLTPHFTRGNILFTITCCRLERYICTYVHLQKERKKNRCSRLNYGLAYRGQSWYRCFILFFFFIFCFFFFRTTGTEWKTAGIRYDRRWPRHKYATSLFICEPRGGNKKISAVRKEPEGGDGDEARCCCLLRKDDLSCRATYRAPPRPSAPSIFILKEKKSILEIGVRRTSTSATSVHVCVQGVPRIGRAIFKPILISLMRKLFPTESEEFGPSNSFNNTLCMYFLVMFFN